MTEQPRRKPDIHQIKSSTKNQTPTLDDYEVTFIDKQGVQCLTDTVNTAAKISRNTRENTNKYFIKTCSGVLYNPDDFEVLRRSQITQMEHVWKWTAVVEIAFNYYMKFLQTKNGAYYALASNNIEIQ